MFFDFKYNKIKTNKIVFKIFIIYYYIIYYLNITFVMYSFEDTHNNPNINSLNHKTMKKLLMIAMVALVSTVACKKNDDKPVVDAKPSIAISVTPTEIAIDTKAVFTVTATKAVESDLTVSIAIDKTDVLTAPTSIIIKKGEKVATFEGTAKAEGTATATISCADATITGTTAIVKVVAEIAEPNKLTSEAPNLTFSTASEDISIDVILTLKEAVDGKIELELNYNFDKYDWINTDGFPTGVSWSEYPVEFPAGETTHTFSILVEQGNAGTLPLMLISISGAGAEDVEFEPTEYDFVVTK